MGKKRSGFRPVKFILKWLLLLLIASMVYVVICKWVMPPITITQISSVMSRHGMKRDYVEWGELSPNLKLAAIASEDQLFPDHQGFDWKAIEKSMDDKPARKK